MSSVVLEDCFFEDSLFEGEVFLTEVGKDCLDFVDNGLPGLGLENGPLSPKITG